MLKFWMQKIIFILFFITVSLFSSKLSPAQEAKLVKRGERVFDIFCKGRLDMEKNPSQDMIKTSCNDISDDEILALRLYLKNKTEQQNSKTVVLKPVPKDAKCPTCGMFVHRYIHWASMMKIGDKKLYFDGVKDMMKYYLYNADFVYNRSKIEAMTVQDFYTLKPIDAKKAFYVIGSNVLGPMGNEFIPFATKSNAEVFLQDHHGTKIVKFEDITPKLIDTLRNIY